ncbi:alpha/beta fold hydrolase [Saccharopolyspora indica]|uniref:thioesterase II family protein n=1 Tax=Saccharopolyspora indica TaxID=1229659 RepID=UPI0022EABC03|nr:alpha/beta fold hydrolase [Saccharopolyspora indica]MDA3647907.1 alpha/beta fold hydrolase [Saccharopolyspora indica]
MQPLTLFCFPHAGGSATAYRPWRALFDDRVELRPLELPGHGALMSQPLLENIGDLVSHLVREMLVQIADHNVSRYALFGHSLGSLLAFETALRLRPEPRPAALVVSGRNAPSVPHRAPRTPHGTAHMAGLPDDDLVVALRELDGIPPVVEHNRDLLELFLPALRTDLRIAETYQPRPGVRVECPIAVIGAEDDPMTDAPGLAEWSAATTARTASRTVSGGHMAVQKPEFCRSVVDALESLNVLRSHRDVVGENANAG